MLKLNPIPSYPTTWNSLGTAQPQLVDCIWTGVIEGGNTTAIFKSLKQNRRYKHHWHEWWHCNWIIVPPIHPSTSQSSFIFSNLVVTFGVGWGTDAPNTYIYLDETITTQTTDFGGMGGGWTHSQFCVTRISLSVRVVVNIWQVSACKMEPQSGFMI